MFIIHDPSLLTIVVVWRFTESWRNQHRRRNLKSLTSWKLSAAYQSRVTVIIPFRAINPARECLVAHHADRFPNFGTIWVESRGPEPDPFAAAVWDAWAVPRREALRVDHNVRWRHHDAWLYHLLYVLDVARVLVLIVSPEVEYAGESEVVTDPAFRRLALRAPCNDAL